MLDQAERNLSIRLLKEVMVVFESDLPSSKAAADAKVEQRWSRPRAIEVEKQRLKDYYDDFCIEIGLISVELESPNIELKVADELWDVVEPLLNILESLLPGRFRILKQVRLPWASCASTHSGGLVR
jgi:hypothetical protein